MSIIVGSFEKCKNEYYIKEVKRNFLDGSQTRSFCYVDDLVEGIYRLLLSDINEPVNLGNPDEVSIRVFASEILQLTGSQNQIEFKPLPVDDPMQRQPDIEKAKELLDWEPRISRSEGLKYTYDYFRSLPKEDLYKTEHNNFEEYIKK